jgi:DNA-binding NtrC family response regulator
VIRVELPPLRQRPEDFPQIVRTLLRRLGADEAASARFTEPGFVAGLARDWQGWPGERRWHSLEEELTIAATHHGRRVELVVTLRRGIDADAWTVTLPVSLAPGEALARAARDVAALFRGG